ncbi:MAG: acyl--CoA ligase [Chromatiales bacterium]|jgi:acyl-CoA synthetase (AMP-forming)/AMP-acid ligase II|nr:acyl--CoA ligase [Chromatiales bacterium]
MTNAYTMPLPIGFQHMSLAGGIRAAAQRNPNKVVYKCGQTLRTYREFVERMDRISSGLSSGLGLKPGTHGAIVSQNCIEYIEILVGASQAGVALATVNPRLTPNEIVAVCDDAGAQVVFADADCAEALKDSRFATATTIIVIGDDLDSWLQKATGIIQLPVINEWDTLVIPYTSGTTGKPKGVLVPHRSRVITLFSCAVEYGCYSPDDRFLAIAPMCHGAGMLFALAPAFFGGYCEIMSKFEPEAVLRAYASEQITGFFGVPTHFKVMMGQEKAILDAGRNNVLRAVISNAAAMPQALKEVLVDYFGEGLLHETYGSTEASVVSNLRPADQLRKQQCVGQPFPYTQVKLLNTDGEECAPEEVGELFTLSPCLFNGYWQRDEATAEAFRDGWVTVGDMAKKDDEGHLYIVDRKKDMVISGGYNIFPREIEEWLFKHPDIADIAVVGVPDEKWGESLRAFVVGKEGASVDAKSVAEFCDGQLSGFKIPKDIVMIDSLPRNANGKVLKTELRKND